MAILEEEYSREEDSKGQGVVGVKVEEQKSPDWIVTHRNKLSGGMEGEKVLLVCDSWEMIGNQRHLSRDDKVLGRMSWGRHLSCDGHCPPKPPRALHPQSVQNTRHVLSCSAKVEAPRVPAPGDHVSLPSSGVHCFNFSSHNCNSQSSTSSHSRSHNTNKRRLERKSSGWRPSFCILLGLVILLLPLTMSSPVPNERSSSSHSNSGGSLRHARHSKWINPCKFSTALAPPKSISLAENMQMYRNIIDATHKAIIHAKDFMPQYYQEIFGEELNPGHLKDFHEPWLVDVMKRVGKYLGEDVEPAALADLDVSEHLRAMYEGLQKFSVGLEQLVLDQSVYSGSFHANFHECEFKLKYILCEIQIAMWEKQIPYTDQTRDLMEQKHRDIDSATQRNIRDWVIFKDYVTTLEYLIQTFNYFLAQAEKEK